MSLPAAEVVELADQVQQARGGGLEVGGQRGDLVAEAPQLGDAVQAGDGGGRMIQHGGSPLVCWGDSTPGFSRLLGASETRGADALNDFAWLSRDHGGQRPFTTR